MNPAVETAEKCHARRRPALRTHLRLPTRGTLFAALLILYGLSFILTTIRTCTRYDGIAPGQRQWLIEIPAAAKHLEPKIIRQLENVSGIISIDEIDGEDLIGVNAQEKEFLPKILIAHIREQARHQTKNLQDFLKRMHAGIRVEEPGRAEQESQKNIYMLRLGLSAMIILLHAVILCVLSFIAGTVRPLLNNAAIANIRHIPQLKKLLLRLGALTVTAAASGCLIAAVLVSGFAVNMTRPPVLIWPLMPAAAVIAADLLYLAALLGLLPLRKANKPRRR